MRTRRAQEARGGGGCADLVKLGTQQRAQGLPVDWLDPQQEQSPREPTNYGGSPCTILFSTTYWGLWHMFAHIRLPLTTAKDLVSWSLELGPCWELKETPALIPWVLQETDLLILVFILPAAFHIHTGSLALSLSLSLSRPSCSPRHLQN
jgi:hypothetical protein